MAGALIGIARKPRRFAPPETMARADVSFSGGIEGDYRGALKPRGRRQVTIMARADWEAALSELPGTDGGGLAWSDRRVNLLCDGIDLPRRPGARLRVADVLLEITGECDPCRRMDAVRPGLQAALRPGWRGGRLLRVLAEGTVAVGDPIEVQEGLATAL